MKPPRCWRWACVAIGLCCVAGCNARTERSGVGGELATRASPPQKKLVEDWREFSSALGRFSISLPGLPNETLVPVQSAGGTLKQHTLDLVVRLPDNSVQAYLTSYVDFSDSSIAPVGKRKFLEKTWQETFGPLKDTVVYKKATTYRGRPALEWQMRRQEKKRVIVTTARHLLDGNRLYMLAAIMDEAQVQRGDAKRYLDSFKIS